MIPHHRHPPAHSALGSAFGYVAKYAVRSNDVLDGNLRVTVEEEGTGKIIWYMERMLTEHEIVESLLQSDGDILRWTIHSPVAGWYLRLRSPLFPPESFVPLLPCTPADGPQEPGTLAFICQTHIDMTPPPPAYPSPPPNPSTPSTIDMGRRESVASDHSYPPPPSPFHSPSNTTFNESTTSISEAATLVSENRSSASSSRSTVVGSSSASIPEEQKYTPQPSFRKPETTRFFLSPQTEHRSHHLANNSLGMGSGAGMSSNVKRASSFLPLAVTGAFMNSRKSFTLHTPSLPPVLLFTDTTKLLSLGSQATGTIELDHGVARALGVEPSWWIAIALAFLGFLDDKDGYLAAANG